LEKKRPSGGCKSIKTTKNREKDGGKGQGCNPQVTRGGKARGIKGKRKIKRKKKKERTKGGIKKILSSVSDSKKEKGPKRLRIKNTKSRKERIVEKRLWGGRK